MRPTIGSKQALITISEILRLRHSPTLKQDLTLMIKVVRNYILETRNGYPNQNSWACGRQDAYADKVDAMFSRFEALKGAYQLQSGKADILSKHINYAIGS